MITLDSEQLRVKLLTEYSPLNFIMLYRTHHRANLTVQLTGSGSVVLPNQSRAIYSSYIHSSLSRSRNVVMNELNNDAGYPQPNLLVGDHAYHSNNSSPNYLMMNIRKMSEYGPDTVKISEFGIEKPPKEYNPARILSIKKQQNSLKASTKIFLNKQIKVPLPKHQEKKLNKLDAALQLHDRVLEIKQSYNGGSRRASISACSQLHRYTESYVHKRSSTIKKRAYEQVFGEERGVRSMIPRQRELRTAEEDSRRLNRRDLKLAQRSRMNETTTMKFQKVIGKLSSIDQVFEGKLNKNQLQQQIESEVQAQYKSQRLNRTEQDQMLREVRQFVRKDREAKADKSYSRIETLADLQKLDPDFCRQFRRHKEKKLVKMRCDLMLDESLAIWQQQTLQPEKQLPERPAEDSQDQNEHNGRQIIVARPQSFTPLEEVLEYRRMSRREKILDFLRKFWRVKQSGEIFGIPHHLLYEGMCCKPRPYELEGSYLFFRAIEKKDLKTLASMLHHQPRLLFQMDEDGRTPLIYSAKLNNIECCRLFMAVGSNLDAFNYRHHTAVYYAIANRNPTLLFELLFNGAAPWSHPRVNLRHILKEADVKQLTGLIQMARRISIVLRLMPYRQRPAAFRQNRERLRPFLEL